MMIWTIRHHWAEILDMRKKRVWNQRLSMYCRKLFKAADIVSRIGRDEYLVFVPGPLTEAELTEKAEQICRGKWNLMNGKD